MGGDLLRDFELEVYFSRWEFAAEHHLTASDAETLTVGGLLDLGTPEDREGLIDLELRYVPTWGGDALREAIAATYDGVAPEEVLTFAGAGEALFWAMQLWLDAGDHAIVTVPNYQSIESVPLAAGVAVDGLPLWQGEGAELRWVLDLDRFRALLRPTTRLVALNFPNNPTGLVPPVDDWRAILELCDERSIRVVSDEVYRGVELDPARTLPQAADVTASALSVNVLSKAYGLPGLRIGWVACRDRASLQRLERAKHYTSICNAGPSEWLATVALRHGQAILERTRGILRGNVARMVAFAADHAELVDFTPPDGGCVAFPRYLGADGVERFCEQAVTEAGIMLLPASVYRSELSTVPDDRFRVGLGRSGVPAALDALRAHLRAAGTTRTGASGERSRLR
jgi:aspartate/methionine/tyrosine aminotransferase